MNVASYIDHTILKPDCSIDAIRQLCEEAKQFNFAAVCIPPFYVKDAAQILEDSRVKVATVIGFPMGYSATPSKVAGVKRAIDDGAHEIDVVINICAVKSGTWNYVRNDLDSMITAAHIKGKHIKIILETSLLTREELDKLLDICLELQPDYVKTSTGFNGGGADLEIVRHMIQRLDGKIPVKASGGIRDAAAAHSFIELGVKRLGTSSGTKIMAELA